MPLLFPRQAGRGLPGDPGPDGSDGLPGVQGSGDPRVACVVLGGPIITQGTWQRVAFEDVLVDDADLADLTNRPSELKVAVAGSWFVSANVKWPVGLTKVEARIVAPDDTGNPVVIDTDTRKGAERTCSLVQLLNMYQGRSVYLEVRYTGGPSSVVLETARLGLTGGRGVRLYHPEQTLIDSATAWALTGAFDILSATNPLTPLPAPTPAASSDNPGDLKPAPSQGCGPLVPRPPWPFEGSDSGGGSGGAGIGGSEVVRRSVRLLATGDGLTWPKYGTDACRFSLDRRAFAATARGIATCEAGTKFGLAVEREGGDLLKLGWLDGTVSLSSVISDVETEITSDAADADGATGVIYELTVDCYVGYYRASINGVVMEGFLEGEARRRFPANSLIRGGLFTETGDTILVPGARAASGPVMVQMIPGEAHIEHYSTGTNAALQRAWPRLTVRETGTPKVRVKGRCAEASVGRSLKLLVTAYDGVTDELLSQVAKDFVIPASSFTTDLPFVVSLPAGTRISVRLDDTGFSRPCDTIDINALSYWLWS